MKYLPSKILFASAFVAFSFLMGCTEAPKDGNLPDPEAVDGIPDALKGKVVIPASDESAPTVEMSISGLGVDNYNPGDKGKIRWKPSDSNENGYRFLVINGDGEEREYSGDDEITITATGRDQESGVRALLFHVAYDVPCNEDGSELNESNSSHTFIKDPADIGAAGTVGGVGETEMSGTFKVKLSEVLAAGEKVCTVSSRVYLNVYAFNNHGAANISGSTSMSFAIIKGDG